MCSASFWETTQFWIVESRNPWVFKEKPFESSLDRRTHGFSFNTIEIHPDLHSRWRPWGGAAETAGWCGRWPTGRPVLFLVDMLEMDGHLKISWLLNNEVNHGKPNDEPSPSVAEINGMSASFLEIGVPWIDLWAPTRDIQGPQHWATRFLVYRLEVLKDNSW